MTGFLIGYSVGMFMLLVLAFTCDKGGDKSDNGDRITAAK